MEDLLPLEGGVVAVLLRFRYVLLISRFPLSLEVNSFRCLVLHTRQLIRLFTLGSCTLFVVDLTLQEGATFSQLSQCSVWFSFTMFTLGTAQVAIIVSFIACCSYGTRPHEEERMPSVPFQLLSLTQFVLLGFVT
jgi:hypothetical protein